MREVKMELLPFLAEALKEMGAGDFQLVSKKGKAYLDTNLSKKKMKKCIEAAWILKESKDIGIPVLSRDDSSSLKSGLIPSEAKRYYELAYL